MTDTLKNMDGELVDEILDVLPRRCGGVVVVNGVDVASPMADLHHRATKNAEKLRPVKPIAFVPCGVGLQQRFHQCII